MERKYETVGVEISRDSNWISEEYWKECEYRAEMALMQPVYQALKDSKTPLAIGPLKCIVRHDVMREKVTHHRYELPIRAVREIPIFVSELGPYIRTWTLWERIKFVFTNRLPM